MYDNRIVEERRGRLQKRWVQSSRTEYFPVGFLLYRYLRVRFHPFCQACIRN